MATKKAPPKITAADKSAALAQARALDDGTRDPADLFPLSRVATFAQVQQAGITNGMSAEECEARLAKIMDAAG